MSRSKRAILDTEKMLERLAELLTAHAIGDTKFTYKQGECRRDAEALRRISMTLHNWHELECGTDRGAIERDEKTGKPYWYNNDARPMKRQHSVPDREAGAAKRLKKIMSRYPTLAAYVQTDPRGCALYILRPGDVPEGEQANTYYSRGLAVFK